MKKQEIISLLAEELGTTKKDARWIYEGFCRTVLKSVENDLGDFLIEGVTIIKVSDKAPRKYKMPNGEVVEKPNSKVLKYSTLKKVKKILQQKSDT